MSPTLSKSIVVFALFCSGIAVAATPEITDGKSALTVDDLKAEMLVVPQTARDAVLNDRRQLAKYAASILTNMRAAEEARAAGYGQSPEVQALVRKAERDALARVYIETSLKIEEKKLPDFTKLAEEEYQARITEYAYPESIRAAHILLKVDPENPEKAEAVVKAAAEKLLDELKAGADFRTRATMQSEDKSSAEKGGELPGWVTRGRFVPAFEEAAFALKPGEMSDLVRTRFGFHIIKLIDYKPAGTRPFAEVKQRIIKTLKDQHMAQLQAKIQARFQGTQDVEISDEFAEALRAAMKE